MAPPSPRERRTRFVASQAPGSSLPPSMAHVAGMVESDGATGFARLWTAFMSARILIGLAILGLHLSLHLLGRPTSGWLLAWCGAYVVLAAAGEHKVEVMLANLRAGHVHTLISDDVTATQLLEAAG